MFKADTNYYIVNNQGQQIVRRKLKPQIVMFAIVSVGKRTSHVV